MQPHALCFPTCRTLRTWRRRQIWVEQLPTKNTVWWSQAMKFAQVEGVWVAPTRIAAINRHATRTFSSKSKKFTRLPWGNLQDESRAISVGGADSTAVGSVQFLPDVLGIRVGSDGFKTFFPDLHTDMHGMFVFLRVSFERGEDGLSKGFCMESLNLILASKTCVLRRWTSHISRKAYDFKQARTSTTDTSQSMHARGLRFSTLTRDLKHMIALSCDRLSFVLVEPNCQSSNKGNAVMLLIFCFGLADACTVL